MRFVVTAAEIGNIAVQTLPADKVLIATAVEYSVLLNVRT